jgi:hypothetical protein
MFVIQDSFYCILHIPIFIRLSVKIAIFTFKVNKHAPFGELWILELDELDAKHVAIVVNVLQLRDHLVTGPAVLLV